MSTKSHFQQLLNSAAQQVQPQRLLFIFASAGLPQDATPQQRARFEAGGGGELSPLMCVDKAPQELADFEALVAESRLAGPPWQVVFAAGVSGADGLPPSDALVEQALQTMVDFIGNGRFDGLLALDRSGEVVTFT